MFTVFVGEDYFALGDAPFDANLGVVPSDATLILGVVVLVAFILEHRVVLQHHIAVRKALRDKHLAVVFATQFGHCILAKSGALGANVNRHIEYSALYHAHQFCLLIGRPLEVQTTQHTPLGAALVILHKGYLNACLGTKTLGIERLEEVSPLVAKHLWLNNKNALYVGFYNIHR